MLLVHFTLQVLKKLTCISLDGFGDKKSGLISEVSIKKGNKEIEVYK